MKNASLAHFGILGMRWGVRRYQNKDGSLTPEGRTRYDENPNNDYGDSATDYKRARTLKGRGIQELSNDELAAVIRRMTLEKNFKELDKSKLTQIIDWTNKMLSVTTTANKVYQMMQSSLVKDLAEKLSKKAK